VEAGSLGDISGLDVGTGPKLTGQFGPQVFKFYWPNGFNPADQIPVVKTYT